MTDALPAGRGGAIVPAAGRGERLGRGIPKALCEVGGVPMLTLAVRALAAARLVDVVVVAAPPDDVAAVRRLLDAERLDAAVVVVAGGAARQDSVLRGLQMLPDDVDVVLVHDAARPLVPVGLVDAVADAVRRGAPAVVPGLPVVDTVKRVRPDGTVAATVDRAALVAVQTPQGFRRDVLAAAHRAAIDAAADRPGPATDDAGLVERLGLPVVVVPGSDEAFKVTRPLDLALAETLLAARQVGAAGRTHVH